TMRGTSFDGKKGRVCISGAKRTIRGNCLPKQAASIIIWITKRISAPAMCCPERKSMQQTATTGLVLRQVKVGEADQILTILTPDLGVVSASARGSLRLKNKLFSACGLFCYSEFVITQGRSSNFIDSAQVKRVFHGLSQSVEGMALAMYLAEVAAALSPAPPESAEHLRLLLNSLYMLSESKRPLPQLKVI